MQICDSLFKHTLSASQQLWDEHSPPLVKKFSPWYCFLSQAQKNEADQLWDETFEMMSQKKNVSPFKLFVLGILS